MSRPLYALDTPPTGPGRDGHKGLWFDRFFDRYSTDWSVADTAKRDWISTVEGACSDNDALGRATLALYRVAAARGGETITARCDWHFATGLGLPHPVENGFQWHPTLGVPYLPGTAVKGLVRAWFESWADGADKPDAATLHAWFGSEDKDPRKCKENFATGHFIFFDAIPRKQPRIAADIMTPHMGKWYEQGGQAPQPATAVPADWHDPVPVPFLVASDLVLLFAIAPRTQAHAADLPRLLKGLEQALDWLGAGAKTAVGYGHFGRAEDGRLDNLHDEASAYTREQRKRERSEAPPLSPELQAVEDFREQFEAACSSKKLAPNDPIGAERLAFMQQALNWTDPDARKSAGELLQATVKSLPAPKKRKEEYKAGIAALLEARPA